MIGKWTLYVDEVITRRKRWHLLYDPAGNYVTGSQYVADVLSYMAKHDIWAYDIAAGTDHYRLSMQRALEP